MSEHKVLVCGGRDYHNIKTVYVALDGLVPKPTLIIQGGADGADACASEWASSRNVTERQFEPDWADLTQPDARIRTRRDGTKYDANAGPRRNQKMLDEGKPDLVVAFPGGGGTADMVRKAKAAGVRVIEVK